MLTQSFHVCAGPLPPHGSLDPLHANFTVPKRMSNHLKGLVAAAGVVKPFDRMVIALAFLLYMFCLIFYLTHARTLFTLPHLAYKINVLLSDKENDFART